MARKICRVISISSKSESKTRVELSNTNVTRAMFTGFLYSLPEKIISDILVPERSDLTLCSPQDPPL